MKGFIFCLHIYIDKTQLKGRFRYLRITLLLVFLELQNILPCIFGANGFHRHT